MRVLVTGAKDYADTAKVAEQLEQLRDRYGMRDLIVIQGRCPKGGADLLAEEWCAANNVHCASVPALWDHRHASAGPQRNRAMVRLLEPDLGIAFGGDAGTDDCVKQMRRADVPVKEVDRDV